jgi:hypothetical protein
VSTYTTPGTLIRRLVWAVIVVAATGALLYNIVTIVMLYLAYPVVTTLTLTHTPSITFPAVTICNLNQMRSSVAAASPKLVAFLNELNDANPESRRKRGKTVNVNVVIHVYPA